MQVMQPRTKKGPSWKDDDVVPVASASSPANIPDASSKKKSSKGKDKVAAKSEEEPTAQQEPVSDLDWLRRHTTQSDVVGVEKAFEQSDDEEIVAEEDEDADADVCVFVQLLVHGLTAVIYRSPRQIRQGPLSCKPPVCSSATSPSHARRTS